MVRSRRALDDYEEEEEEEEGETPMEHDKHMLCYLHQLRGLVPNCKMYSLKNREWMFSLHFVVRIRNYYFSHILEKT